MSYDQTSFLTGYAFGRGVKGFGQGGSGGMPGAWTVRFHRLDDSLYCIQQIEKGKAVNEPEKPTEYWIWVKQNNIPVSFPFTPAADTDLYKYTGTSPLVMIGTGLVVKINGREYHKVNEGWALVGYYMMSGFTGPLIVGTNRSSVIYRWGSSVEQGNIIEMEYDDATYYVNATAGFWYGAWTDDSGLDRYNVRPGVSLTQEQAATILLDRYFEK